MKQKDIVVYVLGETEKDWTVCYADSEHVHQAAAMRKIVKLLEKDPTTRIEMFNYRLSGFPVLRLGRSSPLTRSRRAWAYGKYWHKVFINKVRKFYPTIEGVDDEQIQS